MSPNLLHVLRNAIPHGPELLEGVSDRVSYAQLQQQHAATSLALIAPDTLSLYHQVSYRGKPQARGRFTLGSGAQATLYDLAITDPLWESKIIHHGPCILQQSNHKFLTVISMGEPFGLYCYKLLAAVILLPPALAAAF